MTTYQANDIDGTDEFSIDLSLSHPGSEPELISEVLQLTPRFCWKAGHVYAGITKRSTQWFGRAAAGSGNAVFDRELGRLASTMEAKRTFVNEFISGGGSIEMILNHNIRQTSGKVFELSISPTLLCQLGELGIGLRIQNWSAENSGRRE